MTNVDALAVFGDRHAQDLLYLLELPLSLGSAADVTVKDQTITTAGALDLSGLLRGWEVELRGGANAGLYRLAADSSPTSVTVAGDLVDEPAGAEVEIIVWRTWGTHGWTSPPGDATAAGRYYEGRLIPPELTWSRESAPAAAGCRIIKRPDVDAVLERLELRAEPAVLRVGSPSLTLEKMVAIPLRPVALTESADGMEWVITLAGKDEQFSRQLPRATYWGMGSCLELSAGEAVTVPDAPAWSFAGGALTLELVWEPAAGGVSHYLVTKGATNPGTAPMWLRQRPDDLLRLSLRTDGGASSATITTPEPLAIGVKVRLAVTWDGAEVRLYVDGAEVAAKDFAGPLGANADPLSLGGSGAAGKLDDVRIWDHARTPEQLAESARRQLPEGDHPGLVANWRMEEPDGDTLYNDATADDSPGAATAHHGTLSAGVRRGTLYEGRPDQHGQPKPWALGQSLRVPGVVLDHDGRLRQASDGPVRSIGPADEGAVPLRLKASWTAADVTFAARTAGATSTIRSAGALRPIGLRAGQWVRVTGSPANSRLWRLAADATHDAIEVYGVVVGESAGALVTLETAGYEGASADVAFTAPDRITNAGGQDWSGLRAGQPVTIAGITPNAGTYTLAADAGPQSLRTVEAVADAGPGVVITVTGAELYDYEADLSRALVTLAATPVYPVAFGIEGDVDPSDGYARTTADALTRIARRAGVPAAEINLAATAALDALDSATVGEWIGSEHVVARDLVDRFARPAAVTWGYGLISGLWECHRIDPPTEPAAVELADEQLFAVRPLSTAEPIGGQEVLYAHNHVELGDGDIAAAATELDADAVERARSPWRTAQAGDMAGTLGEPVASRYAYEADAKAAAKHRLALDGVERAIVETVTPLHLLAVETLETDALRLTSKDFAALAAGRLVGVLSLKLSGERDELTAQVWG